VTDVQMTSADVRASAARTTEAGEAVRTSMYVLHAGDVGTALPGSTSAGAATRLRARWSAQTAAWSRAAEVQSSRMTAAVVDTQARDASVSQTMQRLTSRLGAVPR
jgi:hypothetical protein